MADSNAQQPAVPNPKDQRPTPDANSAQSPIHELEENENWMNHALQATPSWLVSMVVHMVVLLILAAFPFQGQDSKTDMQLVSTPRVEEEIEDQIPLPPVPVEPINVTTDIKSDLTFETLPEVSIIDDVDAMDMDIDVVNIGLDRPPSENILAKVGAPRGNLYSGRGDGRGRLAATEGGSPESQAAVAAALKWLAEHQLPDGRWCFDHTAAGTCRGQCSHPGNMPIAYNAATGLALMPFLGAGQTHKTGEYQKTVERGLYFLASNMKVSAKGGSLYEPKGRLYAHGIGSIVLCEAFAMTNDKGLYGPAQAAINYICYAQDTVGGGWRYDERQAGDTSAVGWQVMALKSGHMAYHLQVPGVTVTKAFRYLDSVQSENGAKYGYAQAGKGSSATTAIGLLCRMYLGWNKENPALARGVKWLSNQGPSAGNMYYNYYATQVMRHWEGDEWEKWNGVMRDQLVNSQAKQGHEKGSWYFEPGDHGSKSGGRIYCTSMATMILEVYYRHLPLFRKQSTEDDFKLD